MGRGRSREKTSSELKFGDCQCQEKLNNPVTSMKVNSRSAAHGKYERCETESGRRLPATVGSPSPGTRAGRLEGGPALSIPCQGAATQEPRTSTGAAQLLDNLQAGRQGPRETLVSTSSIRSRTPAQALGQPSSQIHISHEPLFSLSAYSVPGSVLRPHDHSKR